MNALTSAPVTEQGYSTIDLTLCRSSGKAYLAVNNIEISTDGRIKTTKERQVGHPIMIDIALADNLIRQCAMGGELQPPPTPAATPRELEQAVSQLETGDFEGALKCAAPYLAAQDAHLCRMRCT
ncbi:MAG: hypothetical protein V4693_04955 [Pseudomonadota bacterium]